MNSIEIKQLFQHYGIMLPKKTAHLLSAYSKEYEIDLHKILLEALTNVSQTVINLSVILLCSEVNERSMGALTNVSIKQS